MHRHLPPGADTPNQRLTAARCAAGLTQQQVAELANQAVDAATGSVGGMDADYVSKLERGVHTWPNKHYRQALCQVLGARNDGQLDFFSARSRRGTVRYTAGPPAVEGIDDVNRQAFLRALTATVAGAAVGNPIAEAMRRSASGVVPARAGATEVAQLNHATSMFGNWQDLYGGGVCRCQR